MIGGLAEHYHFSTACELFLLLPSDFSPHIGGLEAVLDNSVKPVADKLGADVEVDDMLDDSADFFPSVSNNNTAHLGYVLTRMQTCPPSTRRRPTPPPTIPTRG